MKERKPLDFNEVSNRINSIEEFLLDGCNTEEEVRESGMLEGYLLIATQAKRDPDIRNREDGAMMMDTNAITVTGGFYDPVTHQLAKIMLKNPLMYARLIYWMEIERNEQQG